jgi:hypothetical protein
MLSLCWLCFFGAFDFLKIMSNIGDIGHSSRNSVSALFANNELVLAFQRLKFRNISGKGARGGHPSLPPL